MRRQSNPITPHETLLELFWSKFSWTVYCLRAVFRFRFIACIQIQSFSGRFIFLHLSTLPRSDFPGSLGAKKHYRLVLFWAHALQSCYFFMFSFMAYANLATSPKRLDTEPGLSLRGGGRRFPAASMNVVPGYFERKIDEKWSQKKPLADWFLAFFCLLGNLKS